MDRNEMLKKLAAADVREWPGYHPLLCGCEYERTGWVWRYDARGQEMEVTSRAQDPITKSDWEAARAAKRPDYSRDEVLAHYRKHFEHWPTCLEDTDGHLDYLPGWSWSVDNHGFMKLGDITYLDFYRAKGQSVPRDLMIKHLEAHLDVWPDGSRMTDDGTVWTLANWSLFNTGGEWAFCPLARQYEVIHAKDTSIPRRLLAEPRKTPCTIRMSEVFTGLQLRRGLAELLQCEPDKVLDTVRNLVPDWHTVPEHVDVLQPVWSHAQGHRQHRPVFLKRPKAPVDQETVDDLLRRFDRDSLVDALSNG